MYGNRKQSLLICRLSLKRAAFLHVLLFAGGASIADEVDIEAWYPRTVTGDKGTIIMYAPQVDSWDNFESIGAWVAFRINRAGSDDSYYGSMRFAAATDTDIEAREVLLHDVVVQELSIEGLNEQSEEYLLIKEAFESKARTVPLDLVLAYLPQGTKLNSVDGLNPEPPIIFASESPAILLFVDGEARFLPIEETELQFVLNTTWDVLRDGENGALFLCHDRYWLTSSELDGQWVWAKKLPKAFGNIPESPNWSGVRECLPKKLSKPGKPKYDAPDVFYANSAAELLITTGAPEWLEIGESGLLYATNANQELFRVNGEHFLLLSGRWFQAKQLDGPWSLASSLPAAFQEIPPAGPDGEHAKSHVRASIPGTKEAREAALIASIPRKAEIQRGSEGAIDINVDFAGDPLFTPIDDTGIDLAVNTSYQVLRFEGVYYLCYNATWLIGSSPSGPWRFADAIPAQFALIPPTSPAYNTTFVEVHGGDEEAVYYAYTSGYEGAYVSNETVVYGTGYAAPAVTVAIGYAYFGGYPYYPYYWWPPTYGYGAWYNPGTGRYGQAVVGYGPYGGAGAAAVYNPETGVYGRGKAVWDNDEFAGRGFAYNPNTDTSLARNRYVDFDDNSGWSQNVARRGDEWRYSESQWEDGRMTTDFESSLGTEGTVNRERQGDAIYSEGSISGENRSANFEGTLEDGSYTGTIEGSGGGSGSLDRQLENGEITGGGSFTKDGKTIDSEVTRDADGVQREFETSDGGQGITKRSGDNSGFAYETGSGDVYAGRDGNVYQKTDDGWAPVENPGAQTASRTEGSEAQGAPPAERSDMSTGSLSSSAAASSTANRASYETGRVGSSYSASSSQLDRDYQGRQTGFDRYSQHQSGATSRSRARPSRGRR
jgi:hypothetical protein